MGKALSKNQQMAAGIALAVKRGERPKSVLRGASKQMFESMSERELEEIAGTPREGKPKKKQETEQ